MTRGLLGRVPRPGARPIDYERAGGPSLTRLEALVIKALPRPLAALAEDVAELIRASTMPLGPRRLLRPRMARLTASVLGAQMRFASLPALSHVVGRLGVDADWVLFGHVHRLGPLPDDLQDALAGTAGPPPPRQHRLVGLRTTARPQRDPAAPILARRGGDPGSRPGTPRRRTARHRPRGRAALSPDRPGRRRRLAATRVPPPRYCPRLARRVPDTIARPRAHDPLRLRGARCRRGGAAGRLRRWLVVEGRPAAGTAPRPRRAAVDVHGDRRADQSAGRHHEHPPTARHPERSHLHQLVGDRSGRVLVSAPRLRRDRPRCVPGVGLGALRHDHPGADQPGHLGQPLAHRSATVLGRGAGRPGTDDSARVEAECRGL